MANTQPNPILSLLNSVRAFATRNPSYPEEQVPQTPNTTVDTNPELSTEKLPHHEQEDPEALPENPTKPKAGLLSSVMQEMQDHELELSQEEQTQYEDGGQTYQTPQEHQDIDTEMDIYNPTDNADEVFEYSYLPGAIGNRPPSPPTVRRNARMPRKRPTSFKATWVSSPPEKRNHQTNTPAP